MIFETIQIEDALTEFEILQIPGFNLLIVLDFVLWSPLPFEPFIGKQESEIITGSQGKPSYSFEISNRFYSSKALESCFLK